MRFGVFFLCFFVALVAFGNKPEVASVETPFNPKRLSSVEKNLLQMLKGEGTFSGYGALFNKQAWNIVHSSYETGQYDMLEPHTLFDLSTEAIPGWSSDNVDPEILALAKTGSAKRKAFYEGVFEQAWNESKRVNESSSLLRSLYSRAMREQDHDEIKKPTPQELYYETQKQKASQEAYSKGLEDENTKRRDAKLPLLVETWWDKRRSDPKIKAAEFERLKKQFISEMDQLIENNRLAKLKEIAAMSSYFDPTRVDEELQYRGKGKVTQKLYLELSDGLCLDYVSEMSDLLVLEEGKVFLIDRLNQKKQEVKGPIIKYFMPYKGNITELKDYTTRPELDGVVFGLHRNKYFSENPDWLLKDNKEWMLRMAEDLFYQDQQSRLQYAKQRIQESNSQNFESRLAAISNENQSIEVRKKLREYGKESPDGIELQLFEHGKGKDATERAYPLYISNRWLLLSDSERTLRNVFWSRVNDPQNSWQQLEHRAATKTLPPIADHVRKTKLLQYLSAKKKNIKSTTKSIVESFAPIVLTIGAGLGVLGGAGYGVYNYFDHDKAYSPPPPPPPMVQESKNEPSATEAFFKEFLDNVRTLLPAGGFVTEDSSGGSLGESSFKKTHFELMGDNKKPEQKGLPAEDGSGGSAPSEKVLFDLNGANDGENFYQATLQELREAEELRNIPTNPYEYMGDITLSGKVPVVGHVGFISLPTLKDSQLRGVELRQASSGRLIPQTAYTIVKNPKSGFYGIKLNGSERGPFLIKSVSARSNYGPKVPLFFTQAVQNLSDEKLSAVQKQLKEAGFDKIADELQVRIAREEPVTVAEVAELVGEKSIYTHAKAPENTATVEEIEKNPFKAFQNVLHEGAICADCEWGAFVAKAAVGPALAEKSAIAQVRSSLVASKTENGKSVLTAEGHAEVGVMAKGPYGQWYEQIYDATPAQKPDEKTAEFLARRDLESGGKKNKVPHENAPLEIGPADRWKKPEPQQRALPGIEYVPPGFEKSPLQNFQEAKLKEDSSKEHDAKPSLGPKELNPEQRPDPDLEKIKEWKRKWVEDIYRDAVMQEEVYRSLPSKKPTGSFAKMASYFQLLKNFAQTDMSPKDLYMKLKSESDPDLKKISLEELANFLKKNFAERRAEVAEELNRAQKISPQVLAQRYPQYTSKRLRAIYMSDFEDTSSGKMFKNLPALSLKGHSCTDFFLPQNRD